VGEVEALAPLLALVLVLAGAEVWAAAAVRAVWLATPRALEAASTTAVRAMVSMRSPTKFCCTSREERWEALA